MPGSAPIAGDTSASQKLKARRCSLHKIDWVNPVFSFFESLRYSLNPAHQIFALGERNGYADSSGRQGPHLRGKHRK